MEMNPLVVIGAIAEVETEIVKETLMGTDYEGSEEYVVEETEKPKAKITIEVTEVLKDDGILNDDKYITVYDSHVKGVGKINDQVAIFDSPYAIDYQIGDKGLFIINEDRGLNMMGFTNYLRLGHN